MYSPHYKINEDSLNVQGMGEETDIYRILGENSESQKNNPPSSNKTTKAATIRLVAWQFVLAGSAIFFFVIFLAVMFFVWLNRKIRLRGEMKKSAIVDLRKRRDKAPGSSSRAPSA